MFIWTDEPKINPEKNSFLLFSQMIAQSIMWDSFRVHTSLDGEGERRVRHILFEKKMIREPIWVFR